MSTATASEATTSTALDRTKANLRYLANPTSTGAPMSLVTRSSLKTFRYVLKFAFYRILRYGVSPFSCDCETLQRSDDSFSFFSHSFFSSFSEVRITRGWWYFDRRDSHWYRATLGWSDHLPFVTSRSGDGRDDSFDQSSSFILSHRNLLQAYTLLSRQFTWRHRGNHFRQAWLVGGEGRDPKADEANDAREASFENKGVHPRATKAWSTQSEFS